MNLQETTVPTVGPYRPAWVDPELQQPQRLRRLQEILEDPQNSSNYSAYCAYRLGRPPKAPNPNPNLSLNETRNISMIFSKGGCAPPHLPASRWVLGTIVHRNYLNVMLYYIGDQNQVLYFWTCDCKSCRRCRRCSFAHVTETSYAL